MNNLKNKNKPLNPVVESLCYNGFSLLEQFLEDSDIKTIFQVNNESPSYTDYAITAIVLEYISENYKTTTLDETAWEIINNIEINESLYNELFESLLDETIGGAIARVYNSPNNLNNSFQKTMAQRAVTKATNRANTSTLKAGSAQINAVNIRNDHETAKTNGTYGNGVKGFIQKTGGAIKSGYAELQAKNAANNANTDQANVKYANRDLKDANRRQQTDNRNTNRLGSKIDNLVRDPVSALAKGTLFLAKNLVKNAWAAR